MDQKKVIEMVCTGNNGRSPVAELIGRNYVEDIGAADEYAVESSGTMVRNIERGDFKIPVMVPIIDMAKGRDIYSAEDIAGLDEALRKGDTEAVKGYFMQAVDIFHSEEGQQRTETLAKYGIRGTVKKGHDQTIARPDTLAVLSMDKGNNSRVAAIYEGSTFLPIIDLMGRIATGEQDAEVKDAFGLERVEYEARVEQILNDVPRAIDRIVGA